jgi:hypothetical protein
VRKTEEEYLEDLGVDGRLTLKRILKEQNTMAWSGFSGLL